MNSSTDGFQIKRALEEDSNELCILATKTFVETFSADNQADDMAQYLASTFGNQKQLAEIQDLNRVIEIAWVDEVAAGFFYLKKGAPDPSVMGRKPVELQRLYVDSHWHGRGIGPALLSRSFQIAKAEGFHTLWLGVWERNFKAQAFYRKHGFTVAGTHPFQLGSDIQTDLIMSLNLV